MVCYTFLPCFPFQHILRISSCLILSPFLTVSSPLPQAGHSPLVSKLYPTHPLQLCRTSAQIRAADRLGPKQPTVWVSLMDVQEETVNFFCFWDSKPAHQQLNLFDSRTRCLPMNLNGLHLLHISIYSEHDFVHDLLIKQIILLTAFSKPHYLFIN